MGNVTSAGKVSDLLVDTCYDVKTDGDTKTCHITSATQLDDGNILLVDRSNVKLKVFDEDFQFVSQVDLPATPWAAVQVTPQEVAVTLPSERTVQFVNLANLTVSEHSFKTRCNCYGILKNKGQLVISGTAGGGGEIELLTPEGKIIRRIVHDAKGKDLFKEPYYLCASTDGLVIYVTDSEKDTLFGINATAQTVFASRRFSSPTGVTVAPDGNLLVADGRSHSIQLVARTGKQMRPFISHYIEVRNCMFYSSELDKLIVTMKNSNKIRVFSWKTKPENLIPSKQKEKKSNKKT